MQILPKLAQAHDRSRARPNRAGTRELGDLVRRELMVEAEHQHRSMVEREPLERGPQALVIDAVIASVRPRRPDRRRRARRCRAALRARSRQRFSTDPVEVRTWLIELVPPAIDLDERVMDEISRIISIADEERSPTDLPGELRGVERCEPATAIA